VPTNIPDEPAFSSETINFLVIGKTTKSQLSDTMASFLVQEDGQEIELKLMPRKFNDGKWWLYSRRQEGWNWILCAASVYSGRCSDLGDKYTRHLLLVKFDDTGVVSDFEVSSIKESGCNKSGICRFGNSYMLMAPEGQDDYAKQFVPRSDQCGVYLFVDRRTKYFFPVTPVFDNETGPKLLAHDLFAFWQADRGRHSIQLMRPNPNIKEAFMTAEFYCEGEENLFLKYQISGWKGRNRFFGLVNEEVGRREISERRLSLMN
jgi:hypothetical protein